MSKKPKAAAVIEPVQSATELSDLFDEAESKIKWLAGRKHLVRVGRGKYDLLKSVQSYIQYLRNHSDENICTIQDLCDVTGINLRAMQLYAQQKHAVAGKKRGTYLKRESITGVIKHLSGESDEKKKRDSEQRARDINLEIKEVELKKLHNEVMSREDVEIAKKMYVAGIVKRHVAWRPKMKKQFRDLDDEVLDFCDQELADIREACRTFTIDESGSDGEID